METKIVNKEISTSFYSVSERKMENENEGSNFVFRSRRKTEIENWSSNSVFRSRMKTKNENRSSIFVFLCRRKTVGTRVHALHRIKNAAPKSVCMPLRVVLHGVQTYMAGRRVVALLYYLYFVKRARQFGTMYKLNRAITVLHGRIDRAIFWHST